MRSTALARRRPVKPLEDVRSADPLSAPPAPRALLPWNAAYESGHELIDREHRELFALADAVLHAAQEMTSERTAFQSALDALIVHIARHFSDEERVLEKIGYDSLEAHKRAHRALFARAQELELRAETGQITVAELTDYLALDVVASHLMKTDRLFFPLLHAGA